MDKTAPRGLCASCGRLDPWHMRPCYCQQTSMRTKEKDIRLWYEHMTEGHPFMVKACLGCTNDQYRHN